ncbi:MAG: NAD-dependent deacetylase [Nitrospinae bacterium]|nr:NAD-dependent deacetylase [Nitrospinota bacterium]
MVIEEAKELIKNAKAFLFTAGAGMGVDSGLPDFRGNEGFWKAYPPYAKKGLGFIEMANPEWFQRNPEFAWGFYGHRLNLYRETKPHSGFDILLKWGKQASKGYFVFTSNVDGHFQKAGFSDDSIYECHGSIHHFQCVNECGQEIFNAENCEINVNEDTMLALQPLPTCPSCEGLARPNILMFGDWGWDNSREKIQSTRYQEWLSTLEEGDIVVVECGAGTTVPTVRHQSEVISEEFKGKVVRINLREPHIYINNLSIAAGAEATLKELDNES